MIGRDGPVKPFELIRWARRQATVHGLRTLEAHVLLLLATYANEDGVAWPSLKTLALDSGLRPTKDGRNSAVSAALARLEELRLIWTKQGGHGRPSQRELLFNPASQPSAHTEGSRPDAKAQPSGSPEGSASQSGAEPSGYAEASNRTLPGQPSGYAEVQPSGYAEENCQGNGHLQLPNQNGQESLPATRKAHPSALTDDDPAVVRQLIRQSLDDAEAAA